LRLLNAPRTSSAIAGVGSCCAMRPGAAGCCNCCNPSSSARVVRISTPSAVRLLERIMASGPMAWRTSSNARRLSAATKRSTCITLLLAPNEREYLPFVSTDGGVDGDLLVVGNLGVSQNPHIRHTVANKARQHHPQGRSNQ